MPIWGKYEEMNRQKWDNVKETEEKGNKEVKFESTQRGT
jgi:hypothetical protein